MQTIKITTSQNIDIDYEVAGLGERIVARIIDIAIIVALLLLIVMAPLVGIYQSGNSRSALTGIVIFYIILAAFFTFYDLICEVFFNGQSVGKRVMKIRVISLDGGSPTLGQYLLRWIFRIVDFSISFQVGGLIAVAVSEKNQRIGDIVAGTTLIKTTPRTSMNHLAFVPVDGDYEISFPEASQLKDSEIALLYEVLSNFRSSGNHTLLHNTASRIKEYLEIKDSKMLDDEQFLKTIIKDYNYCQITEDQEAR